MHDTTPGLMMSRSFGDEMAHEHCGIVCVPELKQVKMNDNVCCLVVCSDGVFEKLNNDQVGKIL